MRYYKVFFLSASNTATIYAVTWYDSNNAGSIHTAHDPMSICVVVFVAVAATSMQSTKNVKEEGRGSR